MKLREVILCGLFIALITVGTFVRIPVGTDVYTLQFLFTLLAGLMLCLWHFVFLLRIELHHRRTDRLLGGGLVLRRAAGSAGLSALRCGGLYRDSPLQGGALDS